MMFPVWWFFFFFFLWSVDVWFLFPWIGICRETTSGI
jgi:hypothetical protein